ATLDRLLSKRKADTLLGPPFEALTLGQWVGISGAAFSTGIGARTNLAFSLLAGIFNMRLGYWWDSGVKPVWRIRRLSLRLLDLVTFARPAGTPGETPLQTFRRNVRSVLKGGLPQSVLGRFFTMWFPLQSHLCDELVARFHGMGRKSWYLSDGGHFENMGGYELIRRRLQLIIIVDAECDPAFEFEGLANLVRKARVDFDAEIEFLDSASLAAMELPPHFGPLDALRRGRRTIDETQRAGKNERAFEPDRSRYSCAHAALAAVRYDGRAEVGSWIVYIKPTLMGDEATDLRHYHTAHPDFPHETTIVQFFGGEQWRDD